MKTKNLEKKLFLNKTLITRLNNNEKMKIKGGVGEKFLPEATMKTNIFKACISDCQYVCTFPTG